MALLEREAPLAALLGALQRAEQGEGSTALVTGEAGIGKTTLVRAFVAAASGRVLTAACDDLATPRTLGPLRDVFDDSEDIFATALGELARERPTVLVVEDAHWADDATLDVLGFLARRVTEMGALLVLTARDDAPLHRVLAGSPWTGLRSRRCRWPR